MRKRFEHCCCPNTHLVMIAASNHRDLKHPLFATRLAETFLEYQNALATLNLGGLLVVIDREADGLPYLDEALGIAEVGFAPVGDPALHPATATKPSAGTPRPCAPSRK